MKEILLKDYCTYWVPTAREWPAGENLTFVMCPCCKTKQDKKKDPAMK